MGKVTHVLFDMDGLLLDTEAVYTQVTTEILARYGKTFEWSLKKQMMGRKEHGSAVLLVETTGIPLSPEEYLVERKKGHEKLFPFCKPLPGVLKLVKHLKKHNVPIIVATSSHKDAFLIKSQNNSDLFDLFEGKIVVGDDPRVHKGKPSPDIFLVAADELGARDHSSCLVFEDSEPGVLAGLNAGMQVVWVPDERFEITNDMRQRCAKVITSLEQFKPEEFGLPPFE
ncbi:glutathione synthase [Boothiomyces sp. JEL0866]|nr:glutathione synthase [Boothiomyces sp. JEL0866]